MPFFAGRPSPPSPAGGDSFIGARRRPPGAAAFLLLFALPGVAAAQEVGGRVLDLEGGAPVAGATVELLTQGEAAGTLVQVVDLPRDLSGVRIESRGGRLAGEITMRAVTSRTDRGLRCSPLIFLDGVVAATGSPAGRSRG